MHCIEMSLLKPEKFWVNVEELTPEQEKVFKKRLNAWDHYRETGEESKLIEAGWLVNLGGAENGEPLSRSETSHQERK